MVVKIGEKQVSYLDDKGNKHFVRGEVVEITDGVWEVTRKDGRKYTITKNGLICMRDPPVRKK